MSWMRVPPSATLTICSPRQMPKTGRIAFRAACTMAISKSSRSGSTFSNVAWGESPYSLGSTSVPPVSSKPSIDPTTSAACSLAGSSTRGSPPARRTDSR
jgi:hypothetical protein